MGFNLHEVDKALKGVASIGRSIKSIQKSLPKAPKISKSRKKK